MKLKKLIVDMERNGRHDFTTAEVIAATDASPAAVHGQLRRLKQRSMIAEPVRGFHVMVPPEYWRLGCLPAEHFIDQLMKHWGETYYIALLSAAQRHGAAHQRPQATQVMVHKNRPDIACGQVRVEFVARGDLASMPTVAHNTPRGAVHYSTPEVTALELVGYPGHAGGLGNVATVLAELAERLGSDKLLEAARLSPVGWSQRLGYLLERSGDVELARALHPHVREHARSYTPLRRAARTTGCARSAMWKLIVNANVESDE